MFGDDDDFNKTVEQTQKRMMKAAIVIYVCLFLLIGIGVIGILYLIKLWFFGGF